MLVAAHLSPKKRGSLEDQLCALARGLRGHGAAMRILLARAPVPSVASLLEAAGASWDVIDFAAPARAAWQLYASIERYEPALVHLHFVRPLSPIALAAMLGGVPLVMNDHLALGSVSTRRDPTTQARGWLKRGLQRWAWEVAAARRGVAWRRVAVSRHVAATVAKEDGVADARLRVIENGIDVERFARTARHGSSALGRLGVSGPAIACVARMAPEKGVDVAIRAQALLHGALGERRGLGRTVIRRPTLIIVGDGPDEAACRALARELGVAASVRFIGVHDDVEAIFAGCEQAWVPSRAEAFGLAVRRRWRPACPSWRAAPAGCPRSWTLESRGSSCLPTIPPRWPTRRARSSTSRRARRRWGARGTVGQRSASACSAS